MLYIPRDDKKYIGGGDHEEYLTCSKTNQPRQERKFSYSSKTLRHPNDRPSQENQSQGRKLWIRNHNDLTFLLDLRMQAGDMMFWRRLHGARGIEALVHDIQKIMIV